LRVWEKKERSEKRRPALVTRIRLRLEKSWCNNAHRKGRERKRELSVQKKKKKKSWETAKQGLGGWE